MNLGDRMKAYETAWKQTFPPRMPIIIRIDGRAFHTYTKRSDKPFDRQVHAAMVYAMHDVMNDAQGALIGYTQSDEASIFLHTYNRFDTEAWFGGEKQKIESIAASIFTAEFNTNDSAPDEANAHFDARAFVLPKEEVLNYFTWRMRDCERNAIASFACCSLGHAACQNKNTTQLLEMVDPGNWNKALPSFKFGTFVIRGASSSGIFSEALKEDINKIIYSQEEE